MKSHVFKELLSESTQVDLKRRKELEKRLAKEAPQHLDSLGELIADTEVGVRRGAVEILRRIAANDDALKLLVGRLSVEPDVKTRRRIAAAIADSEKTEMSGALLNQLEQEEHRFVQASLILALGKLGFRNWPQRWLDFANKEGPVAEAMRKADGSNASAIASPKKRAQERPNGTFVLQDYPGLERLVKLELQLARIRSTLTETAGWLVLPDLKGDALEALGRLRTIVADYHLALSVPSDSHANIQTILAEAIGNIIRAAPYFKEGCTFRLSLPATDTRDEYRKSVVRLSRHIGQITGWLNNPSDYDVDLRVVQFNSKNSVIWRDRRWPSPRHGESRVPAPASIHPSVAAALCFAATESELTSMAASGGSGKVLLDPCCGAGTILSEWLHIFPHANAIGYDISERAIQLSQRNLEAFKNRHQLRVADMRDLPLKTSSVDLIACNLPFGIRVKHEVSNRTLYEAFVSEALRVLRPSGTLVTYTADRRAMESALRSAALKNLQLLTKLKAGGLDVTIHRGQKS
jgi:SAM-dependent methyltransferase